MKINTVLNLVSLSMIALLITAVSFQSQARIRTSVNTHVNVHKNVNVNVHKNVNVDVHVNNRHRCCYHPIATAVVTAAIIGSMVNTLPPGCTTVMTNGIYYSRCGSTWYQPQYSGNNVTYIVVNTP